jgi:hypothetical protein
MDRDPFNNPTLLHLASAPPETNIRDIITATLEEVGEVALINKIVEVPAEVAQVINT